MAISLIGQASAAGSSVPLPPHQAGDLILVWAYQGANNTNVIALPEGYTATAALAGGAGNSQGARVGWRIATSSQETSGNWGNSEEVIAHIYRGVDQSTPIGSHNKMAGTGDITFAGVTLAGTSGASWVATFAGWRSVSENLSRAVFPGLTLRENVRSSGTTSRSVSFDTAGPVAAFPGVSSNQATGTRYQTATVELLAAQSGGSAHDLAASDITTGAPSVGAPSVIQAHRVTAAGIAAGAPTIGLASIAQAHVIAAGGITLPAPAIGAPAGAQAHAVATQGVASGAPSMGQPSLGQAASGHDLAAAGLVIGAPVLSAPILVVVGRPVAAPAPPERIAVVPAEVRLVAVPHEARTITVPLENPPC